MLLFLLNPSPSVGLPLLIVVDILEEVHPGPELMEKVPVLVVRALKVNMKRLVVDEVDQEARTVGGVDDGGEGTWCQLGQKSFIIFPILSCGGIISGTYPLSSRGI